MAMKLYKVDKRGKYSGAKLHFDADDCKEVLKWHADYKKLESQLVKEQANNLCRRLAKTLKAALKEHPDLLEERTDEQIKTALLGDKAKIEKQLKAGLDWKSV